MAVDWNTGLNYQAKSGGLPWKQTTYRNRLLRLMQQLHMTDIYGTLHSNTRTYTYECKSLTLKIQNRLIFNSKTTSQFCYKAETRLPIAPKLLRVN